jgi:hypothetical protein
MLRKSLIILVLPMVAFAQAPDAAERSADAPDKMVCKRFSVIGSLVAKKKICKTKREWDVDRLRLREANTPGQCAGGAADGWSRLELCP